MRGKMRLVMSLLLIMLLTGCGHGDKIASATNSKGQVDVYKTGGKYYYEFIIYDKAKDKDKVWESGKAKSLDEIAQKYGVTFD